MKTTISVNRHVIAANRKNGTRLPVLTVKTYKSNTYAHEVEIAGPCRVVYRPGSPLACGAVAYIVTESEVRIIPPDESKRPCIAPDEDKPAERCCPSSA